MERLLQYVWKHRLYGENDLTTTDGAPIAVIDPGIQNDNAGPDFFNAKVRIAGTVWAGNVEIHEYASEWMAHHHDEDKAYDSVILHVVRHDDALVCRSNKELIPQAVLRVPEKVERNIDWLISRDTPVPCAARICEIENMHILSWMTALVTERLNRKTDDVFSHLKQNANDWNEVFYITLMRNFGFGTNSDAFEWLAKSLPYKYILKHRDNPLQVEALLFGQAGLLSDGKGDENDTYFVSLKREYDFLSKKYELKPVDAYLFKDLRTRPVNFPHLRLAQVAAVFENNDTLFSKIIETEDIAKLKELFDIQPSEYWATHYHFRFASPSKKKSIGDNAANVILINTVVPILFAYGKQKNMDEYSNRAQQILEELPPERNSIVTVFCHSGISVKNAADTQSLIQLRREYCDKKKCLYCRIGYRLVKN